MAGKRKCKICGEWIENNEDSVPYKNGYVHKNCFNIAMKVTTTEKRKNLDKNREKTGKKESSSAKPLKDGLSEEEFQERKKLFDYIEDLTKEKISVATYKLVEDYKNKYKISYTEMRQDLMWYFDICDHVVDGNMVIGVVPMCHTEAQDYYQSIKKANASCQDKIEQLNEMYKETTATTSKGRRVKLPTIDVSAIGGDK